MKHLIVAIPVCAKDYKLAQANLDRCISFGGKPSEHSAIIFHDGVPEGVLKLLADAANRYFKSVTLFGYQYAGESHWPLPQNYAWQTAARHIESLRDLRSDFCGWLWWEADALPVKPAWLDELRNAYVGCRKPFMGHIVEDGHMNGVAVYPLDISEHTTNCMLARETPFDIALSNQSSSLIARANDLIAHDMKDYGGKPPFHTDSIEDIEPATAVLYHGVSIKTVLSPGDSDWPPFTEQTRFKCGLFDVPGNTGTIHFNPTLIQDPGGDLILFTRKSTLLTPNHHSKKIFNSEIAGFVIKQDDAGIENLERFPIEKPKGTLSGEQFEDPRAFEFNGDTLLCVAKWRRNKELSITQALYRCNKSKLEFIAEPKLSDSNLEKNWLWFVRSGKVHCVYLSNPMTVFSLSKKWEKDGEWKNPEVVLPWKFGNPRGGTNPILVGNEYVTFFHSHVAWCDRRRRYFMGAMAFNENPPFNITRITTSPILAGSEHDHRTYGGPPCIFPCGAVKGENQWFVVFGINDENCGWIRIPVVDLDKMMVKL